MFKNIFNKVDKVTFLDCAQYNMTFSIKKLHVCLFCHRQHIIAQDKNGFKTTSECFLHLINKTIHKAFAATDNLIFVT